MHKNNWDDLRFVLAVADMGSVSAAARALGVNHATVLRRLAALEYRFQTSLFIKDPLGYRLSDEGKAVIDALRDAENAVNRVERLLKGNAAELKGHVRLTSTDSLCQLILPEVVAAITKSKSGLRFSLLSTNSHMNFEHLTADLTLRPAVKLADDLDGQNVGTLGVAVYAGQNMPAEKADVWLGLEGALARSAPSVWLHNHVTKAHIGQASDSFMVLAALAALNEGLCLLPCFVGERDERLIRQRNYEKISIPLWIASQADMADTAKIRTARALLAKELAVFAAELAGPD